MNSKELLQQEQRGTIVYRYGYEDRKEILEEKGWSSLSPSLASVREYGDDYKLGWKEAETHAARNEASTE